MSRELFVKAREWERDWGERRTGGLITELADLAESEGKRAEEERTRAVNALLDVSLRTEERDIVEGELARVQAEFARLKGLQPHIWHPIATAPDKFVRLLLHEPNHSPFIGYRDREDVWRDDNGDRVNPTHYQPVPESPKEQP